MTPFILVYDILFRYISTSNVLLSRCLNVFFDKLCLPLDYNFLAKEVSNLNRLSNDNTFMTKNWVAAQNSKDSADAFSSRGVSCIFAFDSCLHWEKLYKDSLLHVDRFNSTSNTLQDPTSPCWFTASPLSFTISIFIDWLKYTSN